MEHIRQAVEIAKQDRLAGLTKTPPHFPPENHVRPNPAQLANSVRLSRTHLEENRIIAHDIADPRSISFDILRTHVLQAMESNSWNFIGLISPSAACGKTIVALNLAISMARHPERSVLLIELDLQRPTMGSYLGIRPESGVVDVLNGGHSLSQSVVRAQIGQYSLPVLMCEASCSNSAELLASRRMPALVEQIQQEFKDWIVIFDLPPLLMTDDAMWVTPHLDCGLFVAGAGLTTTAEMKQCTWQLGSLPIVRVVLNKAEESAKRYYSRYAPS